MRTIKLLRLWGLCSVATAASAGCITSGDDVETVAQEIHTVCATATSVRGVDVSIYQGTIDWAAARSGGVDFTIIRQSHGTTADTNFRRNWSGARAAGIIRGAYQYFSPWADPAAQANFIVDGLVAAGFGVGDLPPTLDVEQPAVTGMALPTPATYASRIATWVDVIRSRLHVEPFIYTGGYYWDGNVRTNQFASLPLWHAQYFNYPGTIYNLNVNPLPNGGCATSVSNAWTRWTIWQFAGGNGRAPGFTGAVDLDVFNGTMTQLRALAVQPAVMDAGTDASVPRDATVSDAVADSSGMETGTGEGGAGDGATDASDAFSRDGAGRFDASADGSTLTTPPGCGCRAPGGGRGVRSSVFAVVGVVIAVVARRRKRPLPA